MNPHNQPLGGQMVPLILQPPYYPPAAPQPHAEVPPRVQVAIGALNHFTDKTAATPLPLKLGSDSEVAFEPLPGQQLTTQERQLQNAACEVVEDYLRGRLRVSRWDRPPRVAEPLLNLRIPCPNCANRGSAARRDCEVCGGTGSVRIAREAGAGEGER